MSAPTGFDSDTLVANTVLAAGVTVAAGGPIAPRPQAGPPARIDRFTVVRELGSGGMGVVYAAYDEQLDRRVAIKLLHNEPGLDTTQGHARLLREAQALARLSHPNVVAVYEVGKFEGQVFLAMEYVQGQSVRAWLAAGPRPWREVVRVFLQAGRGLAAAHAAGLVHRDFKPDNAIVGDDGRVRVLDFGLARAPEPTRATTPEPTAPSHNTLSSQLTIAGAVVGTPAYIAPELYMRLPADARSDQFAFCVSLWEALHGERPFRGETMQALALAICEGKPAPPPAGRRAPAWLQAALVRGLDVDPTRRFASMDALLAAIGRDPDRARVRLLGAAVIVCLVALVGLGFRNYFTARAALCTGGEPRIAEVWGPVQKDSLRAAIAGSNLPYAQDTEARVSARLDAYAAAWAAAHRDACEDTAVRKEQSQELRELRMACLDGRRNALAETIALLHEADATTLERAVQATLDLPAIEPCENASYVRSEHPLPATPAAAIAEATTRKRFERVEALLRSRRTHEAAVELAAIERAALPPHLTPRFALLRGRIEAAQSRYREAAAAFEQAYLGARRIGDDATARQAAQRVLGTLDEDHRLRELWQLWIHLAEVEIDRGGSLMDRLNLRIHETRHLRRSGEVTAARDLLSAALEQCEADSGCRASAVEAEILSGLGLCQESLGDGARALELHRRAHALWVELFGEKHPIVAVGLDSISGSLQLLGRYEEAAKPAEEALALRLAAYGPDHARVADAYNNLAGVLLQLRQVGRAVEYFRETARIEAKLYGPDAAPLGVTYMNIGSGLHQLGRHEEARTMLLDAERIQRATLAPHHPELIFTLALLGGVAHSLGEFEASERYYREALQAAERSLEPDHQHAAMVCQNYAGLLRELGRAREALELLLPTRERLLESLGESHVYMAGFDTSIGLLEADVGQTAAAEARLRGALAVFERETSADDPLRVETLVGLATLVLARDPAEALALVERADSLTRAGQLPEAPMAALHETLAIALVRTGGDRERARTSACVAARLLMPEGRGAEGLARLRKLGLLSPPCR